MTVFAVVQLRFTDRARYDRYAARFLEVFARFKGRLLVSDERPQVLEGEWDRDKLVLMAFPDGAAFREWADSPDYRAIAVDREAGAQAVILLARGVPGV